MRCCARWNTKSRSPNYDRSIRLTTPPPPALAIAHVADFNRALSGRDGDVLHARGCLRTMRGFHAADCAARRACCRARRKPRPIMMAVCRTWCLWKSARYLIWKLNREVQPGERYEYQLRSDSRADGTRSIVEQPRGGAPPPDRMTREPPVFQAETVTIAVAAKGRYAQISARVVHRTRRIHGPVLDALRELLGTDRRSHRQHS